MARAEYKETEAVRGLRRLVEFAEEGTGDPIALSGVGSSIVMRDAETALRALSTGQRERLRQDLRAFLHVVAYRRPLGKEMRIKVELLPLVGSLKQLRPPQESRPLFGVTGAPRDVLMYQVTTFLAVVGEERLQFCQAPDCDRMFIKVGRREYCSARCQRRVFLSTYNPLAAQPRRKDRHGKKAR